jgi:hypothetical protein
MGRSVDVLKMVAKKKSTKKEKMSGRSSMVFEMELELSRLKREKSIIVLNKSIFMYFFFIFLAVVSLLTGFSGIFNVLVVFGLLSIVIGAIPYVRTMYTEEENLKVLIQKLKKYE